MHSLLIVIGNWNLAEMMEPFWQDLPVEEYLVGEVEQWDKDRVLEFYNKGSHKYASFEECYADNGMDWNGNRYRKDEDGVWHEYSTSNPQMKWDWYEVGGRFAGRLVLKHGMKPLKPVSFSWGWDEANKKKILNASPYRADIARLEDIVNIDELTAISVLKDGEWIELDDYEGKPVKPYLEGVSGDTLITVVDYHM